MGEIIYMLHKIQERDQISWACSAQEPKMLPKRKKQPSTAKEAIRASVNRVWPDTPKKVKQ